MIFSSGVFAISSAAGFFGSGAEVVASGVDMVKTGLMGKKICFSDGDFKSALCLADFESITVTKIPSSNEGALLLGGRRVSEGRTIKRSHLGSLVFVPASNSVAECKFSFTVDGYASGAEITCTLKFIEKVNLAPSANPDKDEAQTVSTGEEIPYYGALSGSDPEGDRLKFIIVTYPKNGTLTLHDDESGRYSYTPSDGYRGRDKFTYVVRDEYGNYSKPETVKVKVTQRMCDTVYTDMTDREEYNAAVAMTAMGVMSGQLIGDDHYFHPDTELTRAEFVTIAMKATGLKKNEGICCTYFDDDSEIPYSLKPYIAAAQSSGLINGDFKNGKLLFSPNEPITKYEAAKIMASIAGRDSDGEESVFATDDEVPVWARAGVYAMCALGIFDTDEGANPTGNVTRANAAEYLYRLSSVLK